MDRSKRIREDRGGTQSGENSIDPLSSVRVASGAAGLLVAFAPLIASALIVAVLLVPAPLSFAAPALTDLWDADVNLTRICDGDTTLLLICDPGLATCREGVVYFDSKAGMIRDMEVRPAIIMIGEPAGIRETVLALDVRIPVFIDRSQSVFGSVLSERILPALVLMDADGRVLATMYGGGDSLDGNIKNLIGTGTGDETDAGEEGGFNWWLVAIPLAAALAILPFVID
jgi:hypothetical protein